MDSFEFDSWIKKFELEEDTVKLLKEQGYKSYKSVSKLMDESINRHVKGLPPGQLDLLKEGVALLNPKMILHKQRPLLVVPLKASWQTCQQRHHREQQHHHQLSCISQLCQVSIMILAWMSSSSFQQKSSIMTLWILWPQCNEKSIMCGRGRDANWQSARVPGSLHWNLCHPCSGQQPIYASCSSWDMMAVLPKRTLTAIYSTSLRSVNSPPSTHGGPCSCMTVRTDERKPRKASARVQIAPTLIEYTFSIEIISPTP